MDSEPKNQKNGRVCRMSTKNDILSIIIDKKNYAAFSALSQSQ